MPELVYPTPAFSFSEGQYGRQPHAEESGLFQADALE
jgi:hypothetical protein